VSGFGSSVGNSKGHFMIGSGLLPGWRARRDSNPNLLIRRSGHVVQDRPSMVVGWADIPELSTCVGCCSAAWLQSRRNGADPRPSAFQAGHMPSWHGSCGSYALSPVAAVTRWLLLLLSFARGVCTWPSWFLQVRCPALGLSVPVSGEGWALGSITVAPRPSRPMNARTTMAIP
jgi:hypothetical protein